MDNWRPPELQQLSTQSSVEADERIHQRLHEDLVYRDGPDLPATNLIHQLASARGLKTHEFGPKSIDELKNEQVRLQKWGAKFAGANQVLKNEVESLKIELQKAYASDPLRSGQHVTKEAYDLLARDYEVIKSDYNKMKNERGLASDHLARLRVARDEADEQRNESLQQAASAVDTVAQLKTQLVDAQRIAMQKQGAVQDLDHRMTEMQSRYDILAHHVLQLGEEKTSLLEALRERQSQLDFCLAQLQILDRDSKANDFWKRRCKELEAELAALKNAFGIERQKLMDEIDRLSKLLKDCGDARSNLEAKLNNGGSSASGSKFGRPFGAGSSSFTPSTPKKSEVVKEMPKVEHDAKAKSLRGAQKTSGGMKEEENTSKKSREYKEGTEKIDTSKAADGDGKKAPEEVMRHRGLVIRVRWHPTSGKHTFGTRHLQIDSSSKILGWAKGADAPVSKVIKFSEIKRVAYGYASHMTDYKRRFDCPPGVKTPSSGSGNDDDLTASPVGPARGMLATWPKISLTTCFSIITRDGRVFDFFTATDSEAFDWIMRLSRVLKDSDVGGLHDRISFLAARGWTRLIENCCIRQITCRRLLIEGLEKAGVFAASTGLGTGQGTRKPRVSATKTGGTNAKVFKGGAGLSFKGTSGPSVPNDKSWMKNKVLPQPKSNSPSAKSQTTSPAPSSPQSSAKESMTSSAASKSSAPETKADRKSSDLATQKSTDSVTRKSSDLASKVKAEAAPRKTTEGKSTAKEVPKASSKTKEPEKQSAKKENSTKTKNAKSKPKAKSEIEAKDISVSKTKVKVKSQEGDSTGQNQSETNLKKQVNKAKEKPSGAENPKNGPSEVKSSSGDLNKAKAAKVAGKPAKDNPKATEKASKTTKTKVGVIEPKLAAKKEAKAKVKSAKEGAKKAKAAKAPS